MRFLTAVENFLAGRHPVPSSPLYTPANPYHLRQNCHGAFDPMQRDSLDSRFLPAPGHPPVRWRIAPDLVPILRRSRGWKPSRADCAWRADELVWLVEHPPLYTAGTSADAADLVSPDRFPFHATGRGGEYTYHGPGQRVVYVMLDLKRRRQDGRAFVAALESLAIGTLAAMNVTASGGRIASGSGCGGRKNRLCPMAHPRRTRSRRSASACGAGSVSWPVAERRSGTRPFRRDRSLRHPGLWRHQPCRSRPARLHAGGRHAAARAFEEFSARRGSIAKPADGAIRARSVPAPRGVPARS